MRNAGKDRGDLIIAGPNEQTAKTGDDATLTGNAIHMSLPFEREALKQLSCASALLLSGEMYTLRDAGHVRLLDKLHALGHLPYGLTGATIFYAGPTPAFAGRPIGAIGPTTASRMDFAAPELYRAGIVATIGKGARSACVAHACAETGSVYLKAQGGIAALLASCVDASEVIAWDDLGTEALMRIRVKDFPAYVAIDAHGKQISPC